MSFELYNMPNPERFLGKFGQSLYERDLRDEDDDFFKSDEGDDSIDLDNE